MSTDCRFEVPFLGGKNAPRRWSAIWRFGPGRNAGASNEVLLHYQQTIRFFVPMTRPITVGDTVRLVAGCDKTPETCHAKFENILNFRGEPHIPGNDKVFSYPVR